jgi:hypothetical protein
LCRPKEPDVLQKERRSSLCVKAERTFYCPAGEGTDGKWVDNSTSPSEDTDHGDLETMKFTVVKPRGVKGQKLRWMLTRPPRITKLILLPRMKTRLRHLEYDSDETVELPEDENEIFNCEAFIQTVEEEDDEEDDATVGDTVGDNDEVVR